MRYARFVGGELTIAQFVPIDEYLLLRSPRKGDNDALATPVSGWGEA